MATITGISAGRVDVNSIVTQLMAVERKPIDTLNQKSASLQTKLSVLGSVRSSISNFQSAVQKLKGAGGFQAFNVNVGDPSIFNATASTKAVAGNYSLEIASLAASQQLVAAGQVDSQASIGSGTTTTISFDFGTVSGGTFNSTSGTYSGATFSSNGAGVKTVTIDNTNNTLEGIRDAINSANIGVNATIINDGGASPYRLTLSSSTSGVSNSMSISTAGDAAIGSLLDNNPAGVQNLSQTVAAQNANLKVNGVAITKTSNTVSDAIQGVTLNLNKLTSAPTSLSITKDTAAINAAASNFINAYNDLNSTLKSISTYKTSTTTGGTLAGDPAIMQMMGELRDIVSSTVSGGNYTMLSDVGINTKPGVGLTLDATKFSNAVTNDLTALSNLFVSDTGFATKFDSWAKSSLNVTLTTRTANINQSITDIAKRVDTLETRMTSIKKRYTMQFTHLNTVLAQMSSTQNFVTQNLG